jgi:hypothetical protein
MRTIVDFGKPVSSWIAVTDAIRSLLRASSTSSARDTDLTGGYERSAGSVSPWRELVLHRPRVLGRDDGSAGGGARSSAPSMRDSSS